MTITIEDVELDNEIQRLAAATGQSPDELVARTLREKLVKPARRSLSPVEKETLRNEIRKIQQEVAKLPVLDERSADEIIGYNEHGHFD
jgi:antitoxin VapB